MTQRVALIASVQWGTLPAAVAAFGGLVAAIVGGALALRQARHNTATRRLEVLRWIEDRLDHPSILEARREEQNLSDIELKNRIEDQDHNKRDTYPLLRLPDFFDFMGLTVVERILDFELVRALYGDMVQSAWRKWKPTINYLRLREGSDKVYEYFDGLNRAVGGEKRPFAEVMKEFPGPSQRRQARWKSPERS